MPKRLSKKKRDLNQLAKAIVDAANSDQPGQSEPKNRAAVELGKLGGLKGGRARADKLSAKRRSEIARKAAKSRWNRHDKT